MVEIPKSLFDVAFYLEQCGDEKINPQLALNHFLASGGQKGLSPHPLFDSSFYLRTYPDIAKAGVNPLAHYVTSGAAEGRNPHPLFNTKFYAQSYPDIAKAGLNPLAHFSASGGAEGRSPNPLFDSKYYLQNNPEVRQAGENPLLHFILKGAAAGRNPHPLFDCEYYFNHNPGLREGGINPLSDYLWGGAFSGRNPHILFDSKYYISLYPATGEKGSNPLADYVTTGAWQKRNPHMLFDSSFYLRQFPELRESRVLPLVHYLSGVAGGDPHPLFHAAYYTSIDRTAALPGVNALIHYLTAAPEERADPNELFQLSYYENNYPDCLDTGMDPLSHYVFTGAKRGYKPSARFDADVYKPEELAESKDLPLAHCLSSLRSLWQTNLPFNAGGAVPLATTVPAATAAPAVTAVTITPATTVPDDDRAASIAFKNGHWRKWYDAEKPVVSILLLSWNNSFLTEACLNSVWLYSSKFKYEVILVDNGSEDHHRQRLEHLTGPHRLIRLESNKGYGEAMNIAAEAARGVFVLLLNDDTVVFEGWLPPLINPLAQSEEVGCTGPKLIFPDGRLQVAGSRISESGYCVAIGYGKDQYSEIYRRVREVDQVPFVTLRRQDYLNLSGFNFRFDPAYYEDADLTLKLRLLGRKILCCPQSVVVHYLSATSLKGRKSRVDTAKIAQLNRLTFLDQKEALTDLVFEQGGAALIADRGEKVQGTQAGRLAILVDYPQTLGVAERYALSLAYALATHYKVEIIASEKSSQLRWLNLASALGLLVSPQSFAVKSEAEIDGQYDLCFAIGSGAKKLSALPGKANIWINTEPNLCQTEWLNAHRWMAITFPSDREQKDYVKANPRAHTSGAKLIVLAPPVVSSGFSDGGKEAIILQAQDFDGQRDNGGQLELAQAYKELWDYEGLSHWQLHVAGMVSSSMEDRNAVLELSEFGKIFPIFPHGNIGGYQFDRLCRKASICWGAAGWKKGVASVTASAGANGGGVAGADASAPVLGFASLTRTLEAMSAGSIPVLYRTTVTESLIESGVSGFLWKTTAELQEITSRIATSTDAGEWRQMRRAASEVAAAFELPAFSAKVRQLIGIEAVDFNFSDFKAKDSVKI